VNVDKAPTAAQHLDAQVVPTLVVLRHGSEVARRAGALSAAALTGWFGAAPSPAA
jgi:thioredoxin-like negative regulator of GroEL